jgi:hypothetical protein
MTETTRTSRLKQSGGNHALQATNVASRRWVGRWWILGLLCAALVGGVPSKAEAEPAGSPTVNEIFYNCTFTTSSLNFALTIDQPNLDLLTTNQIEASYIIIYVRQNRNDGQELDGSTPTTPLFTGPVLCTNDDNTDITETTEGTAIPGPVNVLGAEEVSHLQVQPFSSTNLNDRDKRVCHTVASITECFLIEFKPSVD